MTGYEKIKQLAKEHKTNIPNLLALAKQNDPFFSGSPANKNQAEWFYGLWQDFGYITGIHLRRFHYQLVSQKEAKKHDGKPYQNTVNDWNYLCMAGKYARHLGLIEPDAFIDRRNPEPHIFREEDGVYDRPSWGHDFYDWELPSIETELSRNLDWELPGIYSSGYNYHKNLQPYHLELWAEKSTMDDVLIPLCQRYSVNLVTGLGFMSITSVIDLLKRVCSSAKPCRIFYISDFDPAGDGMPTAVARQIEYYLTSYAPEANIKLNPVVLTREQVITYHLPRIPIKENDKRKGGFEDRYGEGAVELDALEALHRGQLAKIIKRNITPYIDEELAERIARVRREAEKKLDAWWKENIAPYQQELDELKKDVNDILEKYQEQLESLNEELQFNLGPWENSKETLRQAVQKKLNEYRPNLPDLPEPETKPTEDGWLYDSSRDYFDQLANYKKRKQGEKDNVPARENT